MSIIKLATQLPQYASILKQRLINLFADAPQGLTDQQFYGVALVAGYFLKNEGLLNVIRADAKLYLEEQEANACKSAVVLTAFTSTNYCLGGVCTTANNSTHAQLFEELADTVDVSKVNLGVYCLAAANLYKCENSVKYHHHNLITSGIHPESIQAITNIVSLLRAVAEAIDIDRVRSYEFIARQAIM